MAFARCKCGFVKKNVPDKHIGRKTKCPKCGESILIQKDKPQDEVETSKNETKIKAESGCPKCGYERYQGDTSCPQCGIIYAEYKKYVARNIKKRKCPNPSCNANRYIGDTECPKCGTLYSNWDNKSLSVASKVKESDNIPLKIKKGISIMVVLLGLIASIFFFRAGAQLSESGNKLTYLRSKHGGTVNEAYYQEIGRYGVAYSNLAYALGLCSFAVSLGLGGHMISKGDIDNY